MARPVANADGTPRVAAERMLQRAFINYQRGWRATMLALSISVLALALLAWQQLGADLLALLLVTGDGRRRQSYSILAIKVARQRLPD